VLPCAPSFSGDGTTPARKPAPHARSSLPGRNAGRGRRRGGWSGRLTSQSRLFLYAYVSCMHCACSVHGRDRR
jgi:hypothetical protein